MTSQIFRLIVSTSSAFKKTTRYMHVIYPCTRPPHAPHKNRGFVFPSGELPGPISGKLIEVKTHVLIILLNCFGTKNKKLIEKDYNKMEV